MAVYVKKWNGSAWVTAPVKKWNGWGWEDAYVWKWTGSGWFQLYPEPIAYVNDFYIEGANLATYRYTYHDCEWGDAKQGDGTAWGGSIACWGYMGLASWNFPGYGSINSVSRQEYCGSRGGSGYYNNDQTIHFYRGDIPPWDGQPSVTGEFTTNTGGPGNGGWISSRWLNGGEFQNWLNAVNGWAYLYIYSNQSSDYLSLLSTGITTSYTYTAAAAMFADDGQVVALNISEEDYHMDGGGKIYHKMPIYKDEANMTLSEIMERREKGIVQDIDPTTVDYRPELKPWLREREVFNENDETKFKIEAKGMRMEDEAQYSLDNVQWFTLYGTGEGDYVQATLPKDFNKYSDNVYVRILDKQKDMIMAETKVEPIIYIPK